MPATRTSAWKDKLAREWRRFLTRRLGWNVPGGIRRGPRFKPPAAAELRQAYQSSGIADIADSFVLYRILGNDLPPRHVRGQTRRNLCFILDNEPDFPGCEKRWIVNRITDPEEEAWLIGVLESRGQPYLHIPFDMEEYARIGPDYSQLPSLAFPQSPKFRALKQDVRDQYKLNIRRLKNLYAMNNNGARNAALADGRDRAKWVLPFDGNCFFTADAFEQLRARIAAAPFYPYVIVPMARITDNAALLSGKTVAPATDEPQIVFRQDCVECFDDSIPYGRRPKVELLWRLGVPGEWDRYPFQPWDRPAPEPCRHAGWFQTAGWVARLDSGHPELEVGSTASKLRGTARGASITQMLDGLDGMAIRARTDPAACVYYDDARLAGLSAGDPALAADLRTAAERALANPLYSVVDKTTLPPSGDAHDYWHPAPYWWPNPQTASGLPYVRRDGERVPGTVLFGQDSERYDRSRLQRMIDDCICLALAARALDDGRYARKAAALIRTWFLEPATRMNPQLHFAQVRRGHDNDLGGGSGIIEFRDIHLVLDAVRLIAPHGSLTETELSAFRAWLDDYSRWIETSVAGAHECSAANNHGLFYDVQLGAIAGFNGDWRLVAEVRNRMLPRLHRQFAPDGAQPGELSRTMPRHYTAFALTGWAILARILGSFGDDLWSMTDPEGRGLRAGFAWLARTEADNGYGSAEADFPPWRLEPLWADCRRHFPDIDAVPVPPATPAPGIMPPDYGVPPFWMLAR